MENSVLSFSCLGFWNLGWLPCSEHSFSTKDLSVALGNQHSSSSRASTPGGLFWAYRKAESPPGRRTPGSSGRVNHTYSTHIVRCGGTGLKPWHVRGRSKENQFNANSATNKFKTRLSYIGGYSQESCWHCYCILLISKVNPYPLSSTSNLLNHYTPVNRQLEGLKARTKRTQCLLIPILGNTQRLQRLHSSLPARGKNGTQGLEPARQSLYRGSCFIGFILYLRFPYTLWDTISQTARTHYPVNTSLKPAAILLSQPTECWDYRCEPPYPVKIIQEFQMNLSLCFLINLPRIHFSKAFLCLRGSKFRWAMYHSPWGNYLHFEDSTT